MNRDRMTCPTCRAPRWVVVDTNGNGNLIADRWEPCDNGCPAATGKDNTPTEKPVGEQKAGSGRRLTEQERETVMTVLRENQGESNARISRMLAERGVEITAMSIGMTYRPKLAPTTNGQTNGNGNGNHAPAEPEEPKRGKRSLQLVDEAPAKPAVVASVLVEALRTFAGHLSECSVHTNEDGPCTCGFRAVEHLIGEESFMDAARREMRHAASIEHGCAFWDIEISVRPV